MNKLYCSILLILIPFSFIFAENNTSSDASSFEDSKSLIRTSYISYVVSPKAILGFQFATCKKYGWYTKFQMEVDQDYYFPTDYIEDAQVVDSQIPRFSFTAGPMVRLGKDFFVYTGAGFGKHGNGYLYEDQYNYGEPEVIVVPDKRKGVEVEAGIVYKFKFITFSCGYGTIIRSSHTNGKRFRDVHFGIGFLFPPFM